MSPSARRPRVVVEQTAPSLGALDQNLAQAELRISKLNGRADLVVFPELFTTSYRRDGMDHAALAEHVPDGPTVRRLRKAAGAARVAVVGTILERDGDAIYDTAILIGPDGRLIARYRKTHLYPAEAAFFRAGDELMVASMDDGLRVGLAICFEHAFPEIFTSLALAGAALIVIPSAVPVDFEYLLELRTRARAQDNQVFVAAANLVGFDGHSRWCGRSAIVNPRGQVMAEAGGTEEEEISAELDLDLVDSERRQERTFAHRRPELYRPPYGVRVGSMPERRHEENSSYLEVEE